MKFLSTIVAIFVLSSSFANTSRFENEELANFISLSDDTTAISCDTLVMKSGSRIPCVIISYGEIVKFSKCDDPEKQYETELSAISEIIYVDSASQKGYQEKKVKREKVSLYEISDVGDIVYWRDGRVDTVSIAAYGKKKFSYRPAGTHFEQPKQAELALINRIEWDGIVQLDGENYEVVGTTEDVVQINLKHSRGVLKAGLINGYVALGGVATLGAGVILDWYDPLVGVGFITSVVVARSWLPLIGAGLKMKKKTQAAYLKKLRR